MDYAARIVNKYRRILLCSVFLLLVLSCNEDVSDYSAPKFKKVVEDPKIEYIGDVLPFNKIDNIFRYKDRLYVIAYHHKQKNYLHVYDVSVLLSQQFPASDGSDISVNSYFVPNPRSKVKPAPRIIRPPGA